MVDNPGPKQHTFSKTTDNYREKNMSRIVIGKTGLTVNRLGFGGIPLARVDESRAVETVVHAVESGVDFIDTARN